MGRIMDILMWTIVAAICVLVVMNADKVAQLISISGRFWLNESTLLTGANYSNAATFDMTK